MKREVMNWMDRRVEKRVIGGGEGEDGYGVKRGVDDYGLEREEGSDGLQCRVFAFLLRYSGRMGGWEGGGGGRLWMKSWGWGREA